ncbi:MAG TPA: VOC family protein [Gemmatimonadales bacterium]|nr:VOC family protein [Gemmatimonadales bacterium]
MHFIPYLTFDGNCREAMEFYARTLRADIESMFTFAGTPAEEYVKPEARGQLMHSSLALKGQTILMASDAGGMPYEKPRGMSVSIVMDDTSEAERIFAALSGGGSVTMPLEKTFWAERFGMCVDRYGTPWMINSGMPVEAKAS